MKTFDARTSIAIQAPAAAVWQALTKPELIEKYMHGTKTHSTWKVGEPITWTGEWNRKSYQDKGTILACEPPKLVRYSYWSSMSGSEDKPENYLIVSYELSEKDGQTTLALTQANNPGQAAADQMAENNWGPILQGLKETAEG